MEKKKIGLHLVTFFLLAVGGLNWLVDGLFSWDIGDLFGDPGNVIARFIYILIGLSAIYEIAVHKKNCCSCAAYKSENEEKPAEPQVTPQAGGGAGEQG